MGHVPYPDVLPVCQHKCLCLPLSEAVFDIVMYAVGDDPNPHIFLHAENRMWRQQWCTLSGPQAFTSLSPSST